MASCMCSSLQKFMHINANITSGFCSLFGINKKKLLQRFLLRKRLQTQSLAQPSSCPNCSSILILKTSKKKKNCGNLEKTYNAQFGTLL